MLFARKDLLATAATCRFCWAELHDLSTCWAVFFPYEVDHAVWTFRPGWDPITVLLLSACFYLALIWIFPYPDSISRYIHVNAKCKWDPWVGSSVILPDGCQVWLVTKLSFPTPSRLFSFRWTFSTLLSHLWLLAILLCSFSQKENGSWPSSLLSVYFFHLGAARYNHSLNWTAQER